MYGDKSSQWVDCGVLRERSPLAEEWAAQDSPRVALLPESSLSYFFLKFSTSDYLTPFTELWKSVQFSAKVVARIFASKNWAKLDHNYLFFCVEF